jgi:hypothetical protein
MKGDMAMAFRFVLPLPGFVLHPLTSVVVCVVHIYLAVGHLGPLAAGDVQWTHIWKGFGALAGAYIFAALASRGFAQHEDHRRLTSLLRPRPGERLDHHEQEAPLEAPARVR